MPSVSCLICGAAACACGSATTTNGVLFYREKPMATNTWTPTENIYADKEGNIVAADDPTRTRVVASAGQPMLIEKARQLGLITVEEAVVKPVTAEPEAKDKAAAPATKDVKAPSGRKSAEG